MIIYKVIEISTNNVVFESSNNSDCIDWIILYGDIINYTIITQ